MKQVLKTIYRMELMTALSVLMRLAHNWARQVFTLTLATWNFYTKLKKSIDKNVGYNHLFLFDQDVKEKIPVDVYKDYIQKACEHIESLLHDNPKMSQRIDLVKKNWLSLTIITSSIDEEFELFKSIRASYSDIEFNATFGQRYEEDFKNYIYKELRSEAKF